VSRSLESWRSSLCAVRGRQAREFVARDRFAALLSLWELPLVLSAVVLCVVLAAHVLAVMVDWGQVAILGNLERGRQQVGKELPPIVTGRCGTAQGGERGRQGSRTREGGAEGGYG
jgi:hypothetical protein